MKYAWIEAHSQNFPVYLMCQLLGVLRSAFYAWRKAPVSTQKQENEALSNVIKISFENERGTYGTRRIKQDLAEQGQQVSRRRIGRLMAAEELAVKTKRKFKATTYSAHNDPIAPNLLDRQFTVDEPDRCYVGDITYIWTKEGWLYLATVIDLYSRKVVGWSMDDNMKTPLINNALSMAIAQRQPETNKLLWHNSDRGSQYASESHRALLAEQRITQSMSRQGNCWDNAVAESFFHTLKTELVHHRQFETHHQAKQEIFEYIEVFYNRQRRHSANDYLSPDNYEMLPKVAYFFVQKSVDTSAAEYLRAQETLIDYQAELEEKLIEEPYEDIVQRLEYIEILLYRKAINSIYFNQYMFDHPNVGHKLFLMKTPSFISIKRYYI